MAINGTFPIGQLPTLPYRSATTQTQKSGTPGVADRTITTPQSGLSLTFTPGGAVALDPSQMAPQDVLEVLSNAGISASLDRFGYLHLPNVSSVSGNSALRTSLGL